MKDLLSEDLNTGEELSQLPLETRQEVEVISPLYHPCGPVLYKILCETSAEAVRMGEGSLADYLAALVLDADRVQVGVGVTLRGHLEHVATLLAQTSAVKFVDNIAQRDLLQGLAPGDRVYVRDALADPAVGISAPVMYVLTPDGQWETVGGAGLTSGFIGNLAPNAREVITASGEWMAPAMGWYRMTLIGGGNGSHIHMNSLPYAGRSGDFRTLYKYLEKGSVHNITIGAGGIGNPGPVDNTGIRVGGKTTFDNESSDGQGSYYYDSGSPYLEETPDTYIAPGSGPRGGFKCIMGNPNAFGYGCGGGAVCIRSNVNTEKTKVGDGCQGAIIMEYHDPAKMPNTSEGGTGQAGEEAGEE